MAAPLPPQAADALRPELPRLADDIIAAIAADVPSYAHPMEGRFGQVVRFGVEVALNRFVDILEGEDALLWIVRLVHRRSPQEAPVVAKSLDLQDAVNRAVQEARERGWVPPNW